MNNLVILPIIIPLITGLILVILRKQIRLHKILTLLAIAAITVVSIFLMHHITIKGVQTLQLGNWPAPFGITMVADMFAVLLVLTTSIVGFCCILYAFNSIGQERENFYFYPLVLFLITGVNGSFLT
ncbi:MAG TPA: Na+/H+ antiporter subunit D, partial [Syntrophomonadaceae bacterium]|nr:Na+/H+ antiporter subunit D [Syntrophomonadaceae bacterium]